MSEEQEKCNPKCNACKGTGYCHYNGFPDHMTPCAECRGTGLEPNEVIPMTNPISLDKQKLEESIRHLIATTDNEMEDVAYHKVLNLLSEGICESHSNPSSIISPEQREEINKFMDETMYTFATLEERYNQIGEARRLINLLLSSEQAWKSEAEKQRELNDVLASDNMNAELNLQHINNLLNQAIEVLSSISDRAVFPLIDGDKYAFEIAMRDILKRADFFLSSLSQGDAHEER